MRTSSAAACVTISQAHGIGGENFIILARVRSSNETKFKCVTLLFVWGKKSCLQTCFDQILVWDDTRSEAEREQERRRTLEEKPRN